MVSLLLGLPKNGLGYRAMSNVVNSRTRVSVTDIYCYSIWLYIICMQMVKVMEIRPQNILATARV